MDNFDPRADRLPLRGKGKFLELKTGVIAVCGAERQLVSTYGLAAFFAVCLAEFSEHLLIFMCVFSMLCKTLTKYDGINSEERLFCSLPRLFVY